MSSITATRSGRFENALYLLRTQPTADGTPQSDTAKAAAEKAATPAPGKLFSSYVFAHFDGAVVLGGNGADYVDAYDFAAVAGGAGDDDINVYAFSLVSGGAGNDHITAYDHATITGGAGNDSIEAYSFANIDGGDGNDTIDVYSFGLVSGGNGNDVIESYDYATIDGGNGDDLISTYSHSLIFGGDGNDKISAYSDLTVDTGNGNDTVVAYDHGHISTGAGQDIVVTYGGSSHINGGQGNDVLISTDFNTYDGLTADGSVLDGGDGNDYLQAGDDARLSGGAGDDILRLTGKNATVVFGRGDGSDTIRSTGDLSVDIGGYRKQDISIETKGNTYVVTFAGTGDTLTLDLTSGVTARLKFSDGSVDITGADVRKTLSHVITSLAAYGSIAEADVVYFEKKMQVQGPGTSMMVGGRSATVDSLTRP